VGSETMQSGASADFLARRWMMPIRDLLTILYFFLTIYSFSGGTVHGIANYS